MASTRAVDGYISFEAMALFRAVDGGSRWESPGLSSAIDRFGPGSESESSLMVIQIQYMHSLINLFIAEWDRKNDCKATQWPAQLSFANEAMMIITQQHASFQRNDFLTFMDRPSDQHGLSRFWDVPPAHSTSLLLDPTILPLAPPGGCDLGSSRSARILVSPTTAITPQGVCA